MGSHVGASFVSLAPTFFKSQSALTSLLLLSKPDPLSLGSGLAFGECHKSCIATRTTSEQSPLCSGLFLCLRLQNKPSARASAPPLRKRSRSARLLGCKRPRDGSLSLPTFCGFESDTQRWDGISFTADLRVGAKSLCSGLFLSSENAYFPPAPLLRSPNESTTTRSINVKKRRSPRYYSMSV